MVHNIPFSGMGAVTNFSRGYNITKLDFRVRYDTNAEIPSPGKLQHPRFCSIRVRRPGVIPPASREQMVVLN